VQWDTGATGVRTPSNVLWNLKTPEAASQDVNQRIFVRSLFLALINSGASGIVTVTPYRNGVAQQTMKFYVPANQDFDIDAAIALSGKRFAAVIAGSIHCEIDGHTFEIEPRPSGVVVGV